MTRPLALLLLAACTTTEIVTDRHACPGDVTTSSSTGDPPAAPDLAAPDLPHDDCPTISDGDVTIGTRTVRVIGSSSATGTGPLVYYWHGTYQTPDLVLAQDSGVAALLDVVTREGGVLVLPHADPAAVARPNTPLPWWSVCGADQIECDRDDDYILAETVTTCALAQGLADPDRVVSTGLSAGAIFSSQLATRVDWLAGIVSWSGGMPYSSEWVPASTGVSVLALHGGPTDVYCGAGSGPSCYAFRSPTESLALDAVASGVQTILCDHASGHSGAMGSQGAEWSAAVRRGAPYAGPPFGPWGAWMLSNYCYTPGEPSPWD